MGNCYGCNCVTIYLKHRKHVRNTEQTKIKMQTIYKKEKNKNILYSTAHICQQKHLVLHLLMLSSKVHTHTPAQRRCQFLMNDSEMPSIRSMIQSQRMRDMIGLISDVQILHADVTFEGAQFDCAYQSFCMQYK